MGWKFFSLPLCVLVFAVVASQARAAEPAMRYQFKGMPTAVYQVAIRGDTPDAIETHSGQIIYTVKSTDASTGQITLTYSTQLNKDVKSKEQNQGWPPRPPFGPGMFGPPPFMFGRASAEIVLDPSGKVVRSNRTDDESQLPFMLGLAWQLVLEPVAQGNEPTWKTQRTLGIYTKDAASWPPRPRFRGSEEERTTRPAQETVTYTRGQSNAGLVTIQRQYDLHMDGANGESLKQTGSGQFVFDSGVGLVKSMDLKYTIESTEKNTTVRIPVTVTARLLTGQEYAKFKAEQDAATKKMEAERAKMQAKEKEQKDALTMSDKTEEAMGTDHGGSSFAYAKQNTPVIGFRYSLGDWFGEPILKQFEPIYERPTTQEVREARQEGANTLLVVAKPGYVVGGLFVAHTKFPNAFQIIYMAYKDGKLDKTATYRSKWIGKLSGKGRTMLAGKGELVQGVFGHKGIVVNGIGLLLPASEANNQPDDQAETADDQAESGADQDEEKPAAKPVARPRARPAAPSDDQ